MLLYSEHRGNFARRMKLQRSRKQDLPMPRSGCTGPRRMRLLRNWKSWLAPSFRHKLHCLYGIRGVSTPDSTVFHRDYHFVVKLIWMPEAGIEPARVKPPQDFKFSP